MNELQKEKIKELRKSGYGYKRVATELGISINTIKSFCRKEGLNGVKGTVRSLDVCLTCGSALPISKTKKRKFCSKECREKWWSKNRNKLNKKKARIEHCLSCGKEMRLYEFETRKFCSHACYIESRFGGGAHHE